MVKSVDELLHLVDVLRTMGATHICIEDVEITFQEPYRPELQENVGEDLEGPGDVRWGDE